MVEHDISPKVEGAADKKEGQGKNIETKAERIDLPIVGMSCASCAATVQKNLAELKGVDSANVNFATTQATVLFQPRLVDPADLISRVRKSGYDVGTASVETPIQGMHCASCVQAIEKALLREKGITIFMVEHVMKAIMGICGRIMVLHHGEKICEGTPQEIVRNKIVIEIYLGEETHAGS